MIVREVLRGRALHRDLRCGLLVLLEHNRKGFMFSYSILKFFFRIVHFSSGEFGITGCPLDFRITLLGDRGSLTRTVRWVRPGHSYRDEGDLYCETRK